MSVQSLHSTAGPRVLLLDDDEFTLELVSSMLRSLGTTDIQTETSGKRALGILDSTHPDVLLCDLKMPDMDGIEFLRHVAERRFAGGVILLSGMDSGLLHAAEGLIAARGLNLLYVLKKPVRKETLSAALTRFDEIRPHRHPHKIATRLSLDEVREGLAADYIEIFFQPKVAVSNLRVIGAECLTRWRHPQRGLLGPETFVPVIEENDLVDDFTLDVFRKAVAHLAEWDRLGYQFKLAINLSMDNMKRLDLPDLFEDILHEAGAKASSITLEITETRLTGDLLVTLDVITRLRLKGFWLSIDDFGTGYSTMENLKRMPFNELKVDRAFVHGANQDPKALAILESSVGLGKTFHMNMVAEGVETQQDWDLVAYVGCNEVQGYWIAKPMPADEFIPWAELWNSRHSA